MQRLYTLVASAAVQSFAISPDGTELLVAADDGTATRWDRVTGALRTTLRPIADGLAIVAGYAGHYVITASRYRGTLELWDGAVSRSTTQANQGELLSIVRDPLAPARILTLGEDVVGTLQVWRVAQ